MIARPFLQIAPIVLLLAFGTLVCTAARADDAPKKVRPKSSAKATPIAIADLKRDKPVDFETEVLPVLRRNCIACHNSTKSEDHLVLETPQTILKGGDSGPAVVPKKSGESLMLKAAAHLDDPTMPPVDNNVKAAPLTPDELGLIKLWIDQGAAGQVTGSAAPLKWQKLPPTVSPILAVAITPDGQFVACGRANDIVVYHLSSGAQVARLVDPALAGRSGAKAPGIAHLDLVQSLAFDPSGDLLASGGYREVKLWRRPHDTKLAELAGSSDSIRAVAVSGDGRLAVTGESGGAIRIWELPSGKSLQTCTGHTAAVTGLRFSADGTKLFSVSLDKSIRVWTTMDGKSAGQIDTPAPINALTLAAGGTQICTGHADNVIRIWALPDAKDVKDAKDGKPPTALKELKGHGGPITALVTLPTNDKEIISGSEDGTARQWNVESGNSSRQLQHGGAVTAIAVRPDGKRIASAGATKSVKLWNADNNQLVAELRGDFRTRVEIGRLDRSVDVARFKVADQKRLLKEAEDRLKQETDAIPKAKEAKTAAEKELAERSAAAKPALDARAAAAKEAESAVAAAKAAAEKLNESKAAVEKDSKNKDLAKAADDAKKAGAEADKKVAETKRRVEETTTAAKQPQREVKRAEKAVEAAARRVETTEQAAKQASEELPILKKAADEAEGAQKQAESAAANGKKKAKDSEATPRALAFSPDNLYLAVGGDNALVQTWSAENGAPADTFSGQSGAVQSLAYAGAGAILAAADKSAVLWNAQAPWTLARTIGGPEDPKTLVDRVIALDFSPDGKLLATGSGEPSRSGELKLWNPTDGSVVRTIPDAHSDTIFCVRFSPNGEQLASCGADRFVKVWSTATGALVKPFEGHTHHVLGVAWQSDGKGLASCGADNVVKIWDVPSGEQRRTIEGFGKEVTAISYVGGAQRVLTTSGDRTVRLHNTENGGNERNFGGASDFLYSLAVTPDGKTVVAGGQDSILRVWSIENTQLIRQFEPPR
ncbi:MAG TPA: c-type cytochrome domain-containing protein [Pirellulales bacterium]|jgi:WD40 repeat protein|nr:c-type cytochrome domain-containing protein [Pirellulales bacterium]